MGQAPLNPVPADADVSLAWRKGRFDVGSDGYRSALRSLLFGPYEFRRPLGYRASTWRVPLSRPLGASFVGMMDVDHQGGLYDIGDGSAATLFCWRDEDTDRLDADGRRAVLEQHLGTWPARGVSPVNGDRLG